MRDEIKNSDKWVMGMETFVNKIRLGPLLHNCLVLYAENANPGLGKGGCVPTNCWPGFPWCLLDETFKLAREEEFNNKNS